jgi:hypothetical protein
MNRTAINGLLFICWIAIIAFLILRVVPGWLAFVAMGVLIAIGIWVNAPESRLTEGGTMFGFGKRRSYDEIIQAIERKRREKGDTSLTNAERRLYEGHVFEAYFYHQGGFDYYFAHTDNVERWAQANGALMAIGRDEDLSPLFHEAAKLYLAHVESSPDQEAMKAYLSQIKDVDARFRAALPDLETPLRQLARQL